MWVAVAKSGAWFIFWLQMPVLVLAVAVAVAVVVALLRARREDVPKVFTSFTKGFGRWPLWFSARDPQPRRRPPRGEEETDDQETGVSLGEEP